VNGVFEPDRCAPAAGFTGVFAEAAREARALGEALGDGDFEADGEAEAEAVGDGEGEELARSASGDGRSETRASSAGCTAMLRPDPVSGCVPK